MRAFWEHATACAVLARNLAGQKAGLSVERFFVAGLLHDIGKLVLLLLEPEAEGSAISFAMENKLPLHEVEREILGFDHAMVSGALLSKWNFPESLTNAVRYHHTPQNALPVMEPAIIHVAESMATAFSLCEGSCSIVPAIQHKAWRSLELPPAAISLSMDPAWSQVQALRSIVLQGNR